MNYYLFPKLFSKLTVEELMENCAQLGLDGPTVLVRDGYWVTEKNVRQTLPEFIKIASRYNFKMIYAQSEIDMMMLDKNDYLLSALSDCGITDVRMGQIHKNVVPDVRMLDDYLKRAAEKAEKAARKNNIRCIIQIHGNLYPHNATAVYSALKNLDPKCIGVKLDPGNNFLFEGFEHFDYQIQLLREYIGFLGIKDCVFYKNSNHADNGTKGWGKGFTPAYEGIVNYQEVFHQLKRINFSGHGVIMPFYCENDYVQLMENLKKEIEYIKKVENQRSSL